MNAADDHRRPFVGSRDKLEDLEHDQADVTMCSQDVQQRHDAVTT